MDKLYTCSKCQLPKLHRDFPAGKKGRTRSVGYYCLKCLTLRDRSIDIKKAKHKKYKAICGYCKEPSKIVCNKVCKKCLAAIGWKYCRGCDSKKLLHLDFYNKRSKCKECERA